jgi:hypothetical protein
MNAADRVIRWSTALAVLGVLAVGGHRSLRLQNGSIPGYLFGPWEVSTSGFVFGSLNLSKAPTPNHIEMIEWRVDDAETRQGSQRGFSLAERRLAAGASRLGATWTDEEDA